MRAKKLEITRIVKVTKNSKAKTKPSMTNNYLREPPGINCQIVLHPSRCHCCTCCSSIPRTKFTVPSKYGMLLKFSVTFVVLGAIEIFCPVRSSRCCRSSHSQLRSVFSVLTKFSIAFGVLGTDEVLSRVRSRCCLSFVSRSFSLLSKLCVAFVLGAV
ncbi:hypothetical protein PoB_002847700 [Plakobranchus ocellatus]|uniref:Uncharacterized protein n=1 Tax=Plakobranchus ocellatus TaxID=259542 RepID=A0AAV4A3T6_9GAST|nr:hypothetical protein PoB_002847700 [Plakobranchus ocellatus]